MIAEKWPLCYHAAKREEMKRKQSLGTTKLRFRLLPPVASVDH